MRSPSADLQPCVTAISAPAFAADTLGTSGPITSFSYIGDSSSYAGNMRLHITIDGNHYYSGASGFCAAYAELDVDEISLLQQMFINGMDVTPRYKMGTYNIRWLVGWAS